MSCIPRALFAACLSFMATPALATFIQIPAVSFVANRTSASLETFAKANGVLNDAEGKYYAAVPFTTDTGRVCRFILVYRDNDSDVGVTARLLKKKIDLTAPPFDDPVEMAKVITGGPFFNANVRKKIDTTIVEPILDLRNAFYFVELEFPDATLDVLGVQIEVKPTC